MFLIHDADLDSKIRHIKPGSVTACVRARTCAHAPVAKVAQLSRTSCVRLSLPPPNVPLHTSLTSKFHPFTASHTSVISPLFFLISALLLPLIFGI